ncbi:MAG: DUF2961 domain-containing protein [Pirellulales bacterium]|nr:DUF2961 domain-containing protein [Pirellulales bacterium]
MPTRLCSIVLGFALACCQAAIAAAPVTLDSLLDEMTDRAALARFPDPAYTCKQASSYDRASKGPDQPGWFANGDQSQYIREETNNGRTEWVMMDAEGPGAIVRWWVTSGRYKGTIRIYLDGAAEPTIEARVDKLIGGDELVGPPLSEARANGRNLYLPIPYAKRCKVTFDRNFNKTRKADDLLYYQINYRTYAPGTVAETFTMAVFDAAKQKIAALQQKLLVPASVVPENTTVERRSATIKPGRALEMEIEKPAALCQLSVRLDAKDLTQALRSTVLILEFDDRSTVWCPVSDFFGSGVGVNPFTGWYRKVDLDGTMTCWWVMPFEEECEITLKNLGQQEVEATVSATACPWTWDDRSMYFHTTWRQQRNIETAKNGEKAFDWNYLTAQGRGVFVGDTLTLLNRVSGWWGEGDEKIYVDGETFPSHFGTGTEDYYGYAWCTPEFFQSPFHSQPRAEGPRNFGNVTNTRVRLLDGIPFEKSFKFDMEVWHWVATTVDYAVTAYWYGQPDAKATVGPMPEEAVQPVKYDTEVSIPGFKVLRRPPGSIELQNMRVFGRFKWHGDDHLWWRGAKPGDRLELGLDVEEQGPYSIGLRMTKAPDYAIVQFLVDGKKVGEPVDFYNPSVDLADPVVLSPLDLTKGRHTLTIEVVGANDKATKDYMVGIDQIHLNPIK